MSALRCTRCNGNIFLEPHSEEAEQGVDDWEGQASFLGFVLKCLLCARPYAHRPYISLEELVYFWGIPDDKARQARWAALTFVWLRTAATETTHVA